MMGLRVYICKIRIPLAENKEGKGSVMIRSEAAFMQEGECHNKQFPVVTMLQSSIVTRNISRLPDLLLQRCFTMHCVTKIQPTCNLQNNYLEPIFSKCT